jgi:hypothetical protein
MGLCGYMRTCLVLRLKQIDDLRQDNSQRCTVETNCMRLPIEVPWMAGMTAIEGFTSPGAHTA